MKRRSDVTAPRASWLVLAALAAWCIVATTGHAQQAPDAPRPIRVGVPTDTYPLSFVEAGGVPVGYVVDLLAAIERTMGLQFERVVGSAAEVNSRFVAGDLDMLQMYAPSEPREVYADFSVPYLTLTGALFTRTDIAGIATLDDLRGRRVLVHPNSLGEQVLLGAGLGASIVYVGSVEEAFTRLHAGEGDATLASRLRGLMTVHRLRLNRVVAVGAPVPGYEMRGSFAVREGNGELLARLNEGLAIVERTGVSDEIYQKWFGPIEPRRYTPLEIALAVSFGLAVALAVAIWSIVRQRALSARLLQQEAQMHRAQKLEAIGTLSSGIAHDFNNILTTILGNADLLKAELPPSSPLAESASDILEAATRAQGLVAQILTFARRTEPRRQTLPLGPLLADVVRFLRATAPATIEVVHRDDTAEAYVDVDRSQAHQALMNVGANAIQAMEGRQGRLEVVASEVRLDALSGARVHVAPGVYACISVRDSGPGIPADVLPRVFDPFFTTKGPGEGTGLGLAVVLGTMQAHQGGVAVSSVPGEGTEVRLYFPLAPLPPASVDDEQRPVPQGAGQRILLLDDEAAIVRSLDRVLSRLGYVVSGHVDAEAAVAAFLASPDAIDAVVTDLTMPRMSGLDVAARLRAVRAGLPVILLSGFIGAAEAARARDLEIAAVIDKPPTAEALALALAQALRAPAGTADVRSDPRL